ncbi:NAD-dependent epimerase/dehydratase family protein [Lentzea tibetensis]|uniref:NAD-dependent epimerase/dehydratase family protein n=1 Tax=Lentzea tibetensis TaxID=2591470 RepID=A0A563EXP8_9PSEU|nr:NAD-dependent epimerase/dehydratase family protein [Lentzea tibetensis]TWP52500.1 NAD-dependent epimerase/dehydratase family protein [Lentzea tibetensis]
MSTALVTGGSGFVGGRLIERLVADGVRVRALARSDRAAERVSALGAEPVRGDLSDVAGLRAAASGCELAFHSAARTTRHGSREVFWADNVDGTSNVVEACRAAGVRRLVHVGSEAALMAGSPLVDVDETTPVRPDSRSFYAATKAAADTVVRDANGPDLETVVLRPRFVWGAGDTTVLPELVAAVRSRRFAWLGGGRHLTDATHVDNAVEGLVLAADRGRPGEAYFVTDGEPVVFRDFIADLLATRGVAAPTTSVPVGLATAMTGAGEALWRGLRLAGAPPLDYMTLWLSSQQCTIDITKARQELGYVPVKSRVDGLREFGVVESR